MGIFEKQYQKILSEEILKFLLEGRTPNSTQLSTKLNAAFNKKGNTVYQFYPQPSRTVFQIDQYNNSLKQLKFDLDLFQEELLSLFSGSIKRINYANLNYSINDYQLYRLKAELESVLFSIADADFYFAGAFDNFVDTSKTNLEETTVSAVNPRERLLEIPPGAVGTKRIPTPHLVNYVVWTVKETINPNNTIISSRLVPGSKFGNMFIDTISNWSHEVLTSANGPVQLSFRFPLAGSLEDDVEVFINRIQLISASLGRQKIIISTSSDNINFFPLTGYENGVEMTNQSTPFSFDFETRLVQFIEVTLIKTEADQILKVTSENSDLVQYQYVFGLSSFAAYTIGRQRSATYISRPFLFDKNQTISRVSIDSSFVQPNGCRIKYSIGLAKEDGTLVTDFLPINPVGRTVTYAAPQTLEYSNSASAERRFTIPSSLTSNNGTNLIYGDPVRGKNIYKISDSISPVPLFNSVELYRGYGAWTRNSDLNYRQININNCYLAFTNTDIDNLYTVSTEIAQIDDYILDDYYDQDTTWYRPGPGPGSTPILSQPGTYRTILRVSKPIHYVQSRGHRLTPPAGTDGLTAQNPNFAVYKVKQIRSTKVSTTTLLKRANAPAPTEVIAYNLGVTNFVISSTNPFDLPTFVARSVQGVLPVLNYTLVEGIDYEIETILDPDGTLRPSGRIFILATSVLRPVTSTVTSLGLDQDYDLTITYKPIEDITHRVVSVENDKITLDYTIVQANDAIDITYRTVIANPDELIKASVKVFSQYNATETTLREGVDYFCDGRAGTIQIPPQSVLRTSGAYIDFSYRKAEPDIEIFTVWCKIDNPNGTEIRFDIDPVLKTNRLKIDDKAGEKFYITGPFGLIDIGKSGGTPSLPRGWVQFIVISKNPTKNKNYETNLIDQVIQLRDINKRKVFKEGSIYFSNILAFRDAMAEKTLDYLKYSTLSSDYQSFAVDRSPLTGGVLLVNFIPNNSRDIYPYVPTADNTIDGPPQKIDDTFYMKWKYSLPNTSPTNGLVVKIDLERDVEIDDSQSPKVFNYNLRVGF